MTLGTSQTYGIHIRRTSRGQVGGSNNARLLETVHMLFVDSTLVSIAIVDVFVAKSRFGLSELVGENGPAWPRHTST